MSKYLFIFTLVVIFGFRCEKTDSEPCKDFMMITAVQVDAAPTVASGIGFKADIVGANLCYSFERFAITAQPGNIFNIEARGNVPCGNQVCAQAIYYASPTGRITELSAGTYTLRFFNKSGLFQSVNVTVN